MRLDAVTPAPYSSALAQELSTGLLERFTRYVRVDSTSRRDRERCPSSPGQLELAQLLAGELIELGLDEVSVDDNGYLTATLEATVDVPVPTIGLLAHLDTSPDAPGEGVQPLVHRCYDGSVIELPCGGTRLDPASMPELTGKIGHDLISSSGDTLLGADDKAGVAEIMSAVAHLAAHPQLARPRLRIGFTPDEEIGEGASLFDIEGFGALCAYTVDGSLLGEIQDETFSAAEAVLKIEGVDVHPGFATGKLVNASLLAGRILAALPAQLTPERTSGRDGFIHVYEVRGSAARAEIRAIVRDFDDALLERHVRLLSETAERVCSGEPRARLEITLATQYPNMKRFLDRMPQVTAAAEEAIRAEGLKPVRTAIRGGTDGSRLSEMGLSTPNLFTGGNEYHSVREWASLQDMASAAATLVRLAEVWTGLEYRSLRVSGR